MKLTVSKSTLLNIFYFSFILILINDFINRIIDGYKRFIQLVINFLLINVILNLSIHSINIIIDNKLIS